MQKCWSAVQGVLEEAPKASNLGVGHDVRDDTKGDDKGHYLVLRPHSETCRLNGRALCTIIVVH